MEGNLAIEGVVATDLGIAPWNEVEIDDGDEPIFKYLNKVIHDEIGTVRAKAFVVESQSHFIGGIRR